jgi:hypothetical protein
LLVAVVSLVVVAWTLFSGQIQRQGIDALFLILVCAVFIFSFSLLPVQEIRNGLLREVLKRGDAGKKPAPAAPKSEEKS